MVLTSVDRDDLPDGGASHIAETIRGLKEKTGLARPIDVDWWGDPLCFHSFRVIVISLMHLSMHAVAGPRCCHEGSCTILP